MKSLFILSSVLLSFFFCSYGIAEEKVVLVEFEKALSPKAISKIQSFDRQIHIKLFDQAESSYFKRLYEIRLPESRMAFLRSLKGLKKIEEIYQAEATSLIPGKVSFSQDPFSNWQWGLFNQGQSIYQDVDDINSDLIAGVRGNDIGLPQNRLVLSSLMKKHVLVAVIDSGVDLDHDDLKENIYRNELECKNGELPFGLLVDKDKNGLAGDCMGWNFVNNNNRPYDDKGHGTHVAGLISAVSDNAKGIGSLNAGKGFKIKILPVKVYQGSEGSQNGALGAFTDKITKGILYAVKMKADVINISMGWPRVMDTEYLRQSIALAKSQGITVVAAAGNNGHARPLFPCSYEGVICVGASTVNGEVASFSNYGAHVDLVAPGEQILSTFPKKIEPSFFSTLGYEIKNGTSQAAPLVSASVAFLKAAFPGISENEIYARLLSHSRSLKEGEKFFLGGSLDIGKSLEKIQRSVLLPDFKKLSFVLYKAQTKDFSFEIPIKNYGLISSSFKVILRSEHPSVHLSQEEFVFSSLAQGQLQTLKVMGTIDDLSADSRLRLELIIDEEGGQKKFRHELVLVRDLKQDSARQSFSIVDQGLINELSTQLKEGIIGRLRTIDEPFRKNGLPEYYFDRLDPATKQLELWFFRFVNGQFVPTKIVIPNAIKVTYLRQVDLNNDGSFEYFIESRTSDQAKIIYSFFKKDFSPFMGQGHFSFEVKDSYAPASKMVFLPRDLAKGGGVLPAFLEQGYVPEKDKNPDVWTETPRELSLHLYYLEPDLGTSSLVLRLVDNYLFEERLVKELGKNWDESFKFLGQASDASVLLFQSENDRASQKARFLFSVGVSNQERYYEGILTSDGGVTFNKLNLPSLGFENHLRLSLTKIQGEQVTFQAGSVFSDLQNGQLGRMFFLNEKTSQELRYDHPWAKDTIVAAMGAFENNGNLVSYYQSKGRIVRIDSGNNFTSYPIERVSFITGAAFSELYYPLIISGKVSFYVDATQIYSGHISLIKDTVHGFVSPMESNVQIPTNCVSMNPVNFQNKESMAFLCREGNSLVMNFLSL